jgi:DNA-binding transcriptional ArsR family regulator
MTASEIAERFTMSKPSLSKHLSILENAGLITSERQGKFIRYSIVPDHIVNTLDGYLQEVCPVRGPLRRESADKGAEEL